MSEYDDDPLVRALRAPGTPDELAGEARAVAAFRAASAHPGRARRALGRLGVSSSALVLSIGLGGGVAAAYTQVLPAPVQDFAHGVLGPVGVPPSDVRDSRPPAATGPDEGESTPADPQTSPSAGSTSPEPGEETRSAAPGEGSSPTPPPGQPSPSADPTAEPTADPTAEPTQVPTEPAPTAEPTATPTAVPTAPPTAGPTDVPTDVPTAPTTTPPTAPTDPGPAAPPVPAEVSIAVSTDTVIPDEVVTLTGTVTDAQGAAVAARNVRLAYRTSSTTWRVMDTQLSNSAGVVEFLVSPLFENTSVRLAVRDVVSDPVRVTLTPEVELLAEPARRPARTVLAFSAVGGQAGDEVRFYELGADGRRTLVGFERLGADGIVYADVAPAARRTVYVARLRGTLRHLPAEAAYLLQPESPDRGR